MGRARLLACRILPTRRRNAGSSLIPRSLRGGQQLRGSQALSVVALALTITTLLFVILSLGLDLRGIRSAMERLQSAGALVFTMCCGCPAIALCCRPRPHRSAY